MKVNFLLKTFILGLSIVLFASCDKDFNEIGVSVVGDDHYGFEKFVDPSVVAYNRNLGAVQTNNLPINALGIYDNPVFGKTTSSFVTQVQLSSVNPTFYEPALGTQDSVYLYIPYYYTPKDDGTIDRLNGIYGGNSKFKLKLYESNKYLQSLDPSDNLQTNLKYYSDQSADFNSSIASSQLNNNSISADQNDEFYFKANIIDIKKDGVVVRRLAPGMFLELDKAFFLNKILNAPAGKLLNNNIFKEYFRGLYFKAESNGVDSGSMGMLNFAAGTITIAYKDYANATTAAAADPNTKVRKTIQLKLTGNTVNLHENTNNSSNGLFQAAMASTSYPATGTDRLYLKGQQGSMAVIELFGGQTNANSTLLNQIRDEKWLINEANLTFYIDRDAMKLAPEPDRIYLYDLNNNQPIADYNFDVTTNSTNSKLDKATFGGIIEKENMDVNGEPQKRGTKYKVRLTHHLRSLVKNIDSTNVRLGLVVTEDINKPQNYFLKNSFTIGTNTTKYTPYMSIVNPLGTVLYGTNSSLSTDERRLKLEIYYTKPD